jgi:Dullard-like phosphatase family protein
MFEEINNNYKNISTDNIKKRRRIIKDNNKNNISANNQLIQESRSQSNINNNENSEISDNDNDREYDYTYKGESPYLQFQTQYNTLDEEDLNQNSHKKKVGKKVNRNFKLLKIIKERMKEQKYKTLLEKTKENKMIKNIINDDNNNKKESINNDSNSIIKNEKENDKTKLMKEEEKSKRTKTLEEEKKKKLLTILSSKKYNKFQRKEDKKKPKQEKKAKKEKINKDEKDSKSSNSKQTSDNNNNKEEELNTLKSKDNKNNESDEIKKDNTDNNEKKPTQKENKNRVININENKTKTTPLLDTLNNKKRSASSTKSALEILELLKMKKKEDNDKYNSKDKINSKNKEPIKYNANTNTNNSKRIIKKIESYKFKPKKRLVEKYKKDRDKHNEMINSLPKKSFQEEEDEDNDILYLNHTSLPSHHNNIDNNDINDNEIENKKYPINKDNKNVNLFNKPNKRINLNMNNRSINTNILYNTQILSKTNHIEKMYEPVNIKKKFRDKLKHYYTINDDDKDNSLLQDNILEKGNKRDSINRNVDKSYDYIKRPMNSRDKNLVYKTNYSKKIYKPKRISINNSPERLNNYQSNTINTGSVSYDLLKRNLNYNSKTINPPKTYMKRSLENYTHDYTDSNKNRTIDNIPSDNNNNNNNNNIRKIYQKSSKKIITHFQTKNKNKVLKNSIINPNNKIGTVYNKEPNANNYIINNKNVNSNRVPNIEKNNTMMLNLEDLMVLEEKLDDINTSLESNDNVENKCINFWNYYYNCSLYNLLEKIFKNEEDSNIVRLSINYKLLSIMVCYEFSFEINKSDQEIYVLLLELMDINYDNLMIICEYILTRIDPDNKQNIWVLKLKQKIQNKDPNTYIKRRSQNSIEKIDYNINLIKKKLKNILLNYTTEYSDILISLLKEIDTKTYEEINEFFRKYILRVNNFEGSILGSSYLKEKKLFKSLPSPYLTFPPQKPYTLVLDLDETLVHFKIKTSKGGTLRARPYLFAFLEEMGEFYELIVWTSATEAYANSLINALEHEKKYFDYILFREHASIIGEDFVKDLTRIGRNLDRIIIIDDMPQNFRLQKENGINIKPYFGEDLEDKALYELVPILKQIAQDGKDVRIGLKKYREEIVRKITSNISRESVISDKKI